MYHRSPHLARLGGGVPHIRVTSKRRLLLGPKPVKFEYLLYFLIVAVTVLAVFFYRGVANDAFRDVLRIYGSVLCLIFVA